MKKNIYKVGLPVFALAFPMLAFAAGKTLRDIIDIIIKYLSVGIALIISLAVVTFIWNVYRYFFYETEKRKEAGLYVLYSTIGFFVILSLWGLVAILTNTFNLDNNQPAWPFGAGGGGTTGGTTFPNGSMNGTTFPSGTHGPI